MSYFASASRPRQQNATSPRTQHFSRWRRSHGESSDEDEDELTGEALPHGLSDSLFRAQQRDAGLSTVDETQVPPHPFPHAAIREREDFRVRDHIGDDLARLDPAGYVLDAPPRKTENALQSAQGKRHLHVLVTLLHRCLLEGHFERASKAYALLLRTKLDGEHIDLRTNARWGIGAELLLRQKLPSALHATTVSSSDSVAASAIDVSMTQHGFDLARDFYEHFIVQYPQKKNHPDAIDSRTFYLSLFSVWIRQVCERRELIRPKTDRSVKDGPPSSLTPMNAANFMPESGYSDVKAREVEELTSAKDICERLDQVIASPPYDQQAELLCLRGYVDLWICDLILGTSYPTQANSYDQSDATICGSEDKGKTFAERAQALEKLRRAHGFFLRAKNRGHNDLDSTIATVALRIDELSDTRMLVNY